MIHQQLASAGVGESLRFDSSVPVIHRRGIESTPVHAPVDKRLVIHRVSVKTGKRRTIHESIPRLIDGSHPLTGGRENCTDEETMSGYSPSGRVRPEIGPASPMRPSRPFRPNRESTPWFRSVRMSVVGCYRDRRSSAFPLPALRPRECSSDCIGSLLQWPSVRKGAGYSIGCLCRPSLDFSEYQR